MGSMQQDSHFKKVQNFKADYADATFTQYESQRTGLRVVVVDRKGPKVYGNFAVATEIHDDSGSRKLYKVFRPLLLIMNSAHS
jgi:Zn-dependent M16 (insulinase) family peptidase